MQSTTKERVKINLFKKTVSNNLKNTSSKAEESKDDTLTGPTKTIRCSSPYETEGNLRSKEKIESKTKWVSKNEFKRFFGKVKSTSVIPNVASQSPYVSPTSHRFRGSEKEKWINTKNFL